MSKVWRSRWLIFLGLSLATLAAAVWALVAMGPTLPLLLQVALLIALWIAVALFWRQTRREAEQRDLVLDIAQELSSKSELGELFDAIVQTILEAVPLADKCVIHLLDESGRRLYPSYSSESDLAQALGMPLGKGIAGQALQERRTRVIGNVHEEPGFLPLDSSPDLCSLMVAPLYVEGKLLGTISLNSKTCHAFTRADEALVTLLAAQASAALYQNQLYNEARHETQYVEAIINNLNDGLILLDDERRVLRYNPSLAHILGADVQDIIGQRVDAENDHDALRRLAYILDLPADDEEAVDYERRVELEEPLRAFLRVRVSPVKARGGRVATVVTIHDETESLEQIRSAQSLLAAIPREIEPTLDAIGGYATLIRSLAETDEPSLSSAREWAGRIQMESARLMRLLQDLDDLSALMNGELPLEREPLRLAELLADLQEEISRRASPRNVSVEMRYPSNLPPIPLNERCLWRTLNHLFDNALRRASEGGHILLDVQTNLEEVIFTLSDDGAPIPPSWAARILRGAFDVYSGASPFGAELTLYISSR
ncbi:MAG: GAF domain-containing protein, partial [Chloroflexi bacterium]|nr:GAF domain-containing protein [Chloroflexota bacterium]